MNKKTYEQLEEQIKLLLDENEKLRLERNNALEDFNKHLEKFVELRDKYEALRQEVDFILQIVYKNAKKIDAQDENNI